MSVWHASPYHVAVGRGDLLFWRGPSVANGVIIRKRLGWMALLAAEGRAARVSAEVEPSVRKPQCSTQEAHEWRGGLEQVGNLCHQFGRIQLAVCK